MIPSKRLKPILEEVSLKLGLPIETVTMVYRSQWEFIVNTIKEYPQFHTLNEDEFNALNTSFNVPGIGKFHSTWERTKHITQKYEKSYSKESQASK